MSSNRWFNALVCVLAVGTSPLIANDVDTCKAAFHLLSEASKGKSALPENKSIKEMTALVEEVERDIRLTKTREGTVGELAEQIETLRTAMTDGGVKVVTVTDPEEIKQALSKLDSFPARVSGRGFLLEPQKNRALGIGLGIPVVWTMGMFPTLMLSSRLQIPEIAQYYVLSILATPLIVGPLLMKGLYFTPNHNLNSTKVESLTFQKLGSLRAIKRDMGKEDADSHGTYFATWSDKSGTFGLWVRDSGLSLFAIPRSADSQ